MYNHIRFGNIEFLFTEKLAGFKLYALERYPFAIKTNEPSDSIIIEVAHITNAQTENEIHQLELSAGYYYDEVAVRGISVGIYLFQNSDHHTWVPHGDWVKFVSAAQP